MGRMTSHISWKIKNVWNHQPEKGKLHDVHYSFKSLIIFPACCLKFCIYIYIHTWCSHWEKPSWGSFHCLSCCDAPASNPMHLHSSRSRSCHALGVDKSTWRLSVSWKLRTSFDLHRLLKVHLWFMTCFLVFHSWCPYLGFLYGWECWSTNSRYIYHHLFMSFHVEAFLFSDSITWKQPTQGKKTIEIQKWCHEAWTV